MKAEIVTLESMSAWGIVGLYGYMQVIKLRWAFNCKCNPDGIINIFNALLCDRGDQQLEGIKYIDTHAPVVQWTTI